MTDIQIALYDTPHQTIPTSAILPWRDLAEALTTYTLTPCAPCKGKTCPHKHGAAWSPVVIQGARADRNVSAITCFVADLDDFANFEEVEEALKTVDGSPYAYAFATTHSHLVGGCGPRLRLVFPLAVPVPAPQWRKVRAQIIEHLGLQRIDKTTVNESRIYYEASHSGEVEPLAFVVEGEALDWRALDEREQEPDQAPPLDYGALVSTLKKYAKRAPHDLAPAVLSLLDGRAYCAVGEGVRDQTTQRLVSAVVFAAPDVTLDALQALFRRSLVAISDSTHDLAHWTRKVAKNFGDAKARYQAKKEEDRAFAEAVRTRLLGKFAPPREDEGEGLVWLDKITTDKNGITNDPNNLDLIFSNAPEFGANLRFNLLTKTIEVIGGPLAREKGEEIEVGAAVVLFRQYGLKLSPQTIKPYLYRQAQNNPFDPLVNYLEGLTWDGIPRVDSFFESFLSCFAGEDQSAEYLKILSRHFLLGAVKRGVEPGAYIKTVPILESPQNYGKSSALSALFGEFFADSRIDIHNKDAGLLVNLSWGVEFAELGVLKKSQVEEFKAFISRQSDVFRAPYGRATQRYDRRAVFIGTINPDEDRKYLRDTTGNARFRPARVGAPIDVQRIRRERDQLWAEALYRVKQGELWYSTDLAEEALIAQVAQSRQEESPYTERVLEWLKSQKRVPARITIQQIADQALLLPAHSLSTFVKRQIGQALRDLGFNPKRFDDQGHTRLGFETPSKFLPVEVANVRN